MLQRSGTLIRYFSSKATKNPYLSVFPKYRFGFTDDLSSRKGFITLSPISAYPSESHFNYGGIEVDISWDMDSEATDLSKKVLESVMSGVIFAPSLGHLLIPRPTLIRLDSNTASEEIEGSKTKQVGQIEIVEIGESHVKIEVSGENKKIVTDIPRESWEIMKVLAQSSIPHVFGFEGEFAEAQQDVYMSRYGGDDDYLGEDEDEEFGGSSSKKGNKGKKSKDSFDDFSDDEDFFDDDDDDYLEDKPKKDNKKQSKGGYDSDAWSSTGSKSGGNGKGKDKKKGGNKGGKKK